MQFVLHKNLLVFLVFRYNIFQPNTTVEKVTKKQEPYNMESVLIVSLILTFVCLYMCQVILNVTKYKKIKRSISKQQRATNLLLRQLQKSVSSKNKFLPSLDVKIQVKSHLLYSRNIVVDISRSQLKFFISILISLCSLLFVTFCTIVFYSLLGPRSYRRFGFR